MFDIPNILLWLLGILVVTAAIYGLRRRLSAEAKESRRRARSHGTVVSRKQGPSIKLAVDVDTSKKKRKP